MAKSRNLKGALISHKTLLSRKASESRQKAHKLAKQASIKQTKTDKKSKLHTSTPTPRSNIIIPFEKNDTILLIGEANFSFALSLTLNPHFHPPNQILATSYDSREICLNKYPDSLKILEELERKGVRIAFGIDAQDLGRFWKIVGKGGRWSRVIFNFPHVGAGIKDQTRNIQSNQTLLLRFLRSVNPLLTSGPSAFPIPTSTKKGKKAIHSQLRGKANNKRKRLNDSDSDDDPIADPDSSELEPDNEDDIPDESSIQNPNPTDEVTHNPIQKEFNPPKKAGTILITLLNQPPYTHWDLQKLATKPPATSSTFSRISGIKDIETPQPRYRLLRSFQFHPEVYEGYQHRRTIGFKIGVSRDGNQEILGRKGVARTWEFERVE